MDGVTVNVPPVAPAAKLIAFEGVVVVALKVAPVPVYVQVYKVAPGTAASVYVAVDCAHTGFEPDMAPAAPGATVQGDQVNVSPLAGIVVLLNRTRAVLATAAVVDAQPVFETLALKSRESAPLKPTWVSRFDASVDDIAP